MKKLLKLTTALFFLIAVYPFYLQAEPTDNANNVAAVEVEQAKKADILIERLNEIKNMDLDELEGPERNDLRAEVIKIKEKLQKIGGGIYISAGALLIIILLLLLL